jgi:hypothetical protein
MEFWFQRRHTRYGQYFCAILGGVWDDVAGLVARISKRPEASAAAVGLENLLALRLRARE